MGTTLDNLYSDYIEKRTAVESDYRKKLSEFKNNEIENCPFKVGMPITIGDWVGRVIEVGFTGINAVDMTIDNMYVRMRMSYDSHGDKAFTIDLYEKDFDKIAILENNISPDVKKKIDFLRSEINRFKKSYELEIETLEIAMEEKVNKQLKVIDGLSKGCIHDWDITEYPNHIVNGKPFKEIVCSICGKELKHE